MPAYATNMRFKFPIVALSLEIITIILYGVFVVYDDGKSKGHGHGHAAPSNETKHVEPMTLYPSKSTKGGVLTEGCCAMGCLNVRSLDYFLKK